MKALGLNPGEQEMIDMTNEVSINGLIYYPDFCKLVLRKYREENKEVLNQALFKVSSKLVLHPLKWSATFQVICGTDPYPQNFRAKKWKIKDKSFSKADFQFMMRNLPVPVNEEDIDQMFEFADKDKDGRINYRSVLCVVWCGPTNSRQSDQHVLASDSSRTITSGITRFWSLRDSEASRH